jgi:hypothetical protein
MASARPEMDEREIVLGQMGQRSINRALRKVQLTRDTARQIRNERDSRILRFWRKKPPWLSELVQFTAALDELCLFLEGASMIDQPGEVHPGLT